MFHPKVRSGAALLRPALYLLPPSPYLDVCVLYAAILGIVLPQTNCSFFRKAGPRKVKVLMGRGVVPMPALVVIGLWIVLQFFSGIGSIANTAETGGVAYMAHIGGFIAGFVLTFLFRGSRGAQTTS